MSEPLRVMVIGTHPDDTDDVADVWRERHPGTSVPAYIEVYEFSEYGRAPTPAELVWFKRTARLTSAYRRYAWRRNNGAKMP